MNTHDKIANWIDWLSISVAASTCEAYSWELRHVEAWARKTLGKEVMSLTRDNLTHYLARRAVDGVGEATIRRSINALRAFYKYALGRKSPAKSIKPKPVKRKAHRTLDAESAFKVMLSADTSTVIGKRNLAIICLGLSSGLRSSELCHLLLSEIDLKHGRLTTKIKGGDDGDGVFGPDTAAALSSWLAVRVALPGVETVFVSVGGLKAGTPITPSGLRCIFRSIGKAAGLEHGFSPHDLRRSFATLSHRFGAPTRIVQVAGRWTDLAQVVTYTQAIDQADFAPYDPVSHIMGDKPEA